MARRLGSRMSGRIKRLGDIIVYVVASLYTSMAMAACQSASQSHAFVAAISNP